MHGDFAGMLAWTTVDRLLAQPAGLVALLNSGCRLCVCVGTFQQRVTM